MAVGHEKPGLTTGQKFGVAGMVFCVGGLLLPLVVFFGLRATLWSVSVEPGVREVQLDAGTVFIYPEDSDLLSPTFTIVDGTDEPLFVDFQGELGHSVRIPRDDVYVVTTDQAVDLGSDRGVPALIALIAGLVTVPLGLISGVIGLVLFVVTRKKT